MRNHPVFTLGTATPNGEATSPAEHGNDIDHNLRPRAIYDGKPVNEPTAVTAGHGRQLSLDHHGQRLYVSLPPGRQVAVPVEFLPQAGRQFTVARRVILGDNPRVARLEVAILRAMVTMIETAVILIFVFGVFLPVFLILVPMLGESRTAYQDTESYQGYYPTHKSSSSVFFNPYCNLVTAEHFSVSH
jgi:hypothetical protein